MHYASRLLTALCAALVVGGCSGGESTAPTNTDTFGGSATATSVDVLMPGLVYTPNRVDIAQGGTVRFVFAALAHDVRFNSSTGAPADVQVTANATVSRTFATKGSFPFLCTLHANMTGTVTVH